MDYEKAFETEKPVKDTDSQPEAFVVQANPK
jgi:hypothetical protein